MSDGYDQGRHNRAEDGSLDQSFGAETTTDDVLDRIDLSGRRVLVTGVSAGLGVETVRALAAHGAQVVGAARDLDKARASTAKVRSGGEDGLTLVELDLADLASVRACSDALLEANEPFDLVIANAGVMAAPEGRTTDGFETQFGTNHLGHFVLINRLAPLMRPGARLVNLLSRGHHASDVDLADPNFDTTPYDPWAAYGRSKTANILFAVEFDRRHRDSGVRATAVHPGVILTELSRHMTQEMRDAMAAARKAGGQPAIAYKSVAQGAATSLWAGIIADADAVGGRYCEDCHVAALTDDPGSRNGVRGYALDSERGKALWTKSEEMVGERFD